MHGTASYGDTAACCWAVGEVRKLKSSPKAVLLVFLLVAVAPLASLLLPPWGCMQSFSDSDESAIDASSLPAVEHVRAAISGTAMSDPSLREMLERLAVQLQLDDRDVNSFVRDGDDVPDRPALVARLVFELLDSSPRRVCTAWLRVLRQWPVPPVPCVRLQALRHDLDEDGCDVLFSLCYWLRDFGVRDSFATYSGASSPPSGSTGDGVGYVDGSPAAAGVGSSFAPSVLQGFPVGPAPPASSSPSAARAPSPGRRVSGRPSSPGRAFSFPPSPPTPGSFAANVRDSFRVPGQDTILPPRNGPVPDDMPGAAGLLLSGAAVPGARRGRLAALLPRLAPLEAPAGDRARSRIDRVTPEPELARRRPTACWCVFLQDQRITPALCSATCDGALEQLLAMALLLT